MATITSLSSQSNLYTLASQMSAVYMQPVYRLQDRRGNLDTNKRSLDTRIDALDDAIERAEARAAAKEQRLIDQYARLQEVMAYFQNQQSCL